MPTPEFAASLGRLAANHLWQSTGFAAVAVLLALALRANRARTRYWLWLAASVKFLVPFSVLAAIGSGLGRWFVPATPLSRLPFVMEQIVQPFAPIQDAVTPVAASAPAPNLLPALLLAAWFCSFVAVLLYGWVRWRRVATAVRASTALREGRELEAWGRLAARQPARWLTTTARADWQSARSLASCPTGKGHATIRLVSSTAKLEPGVFGIFRPVLWLPAGIGDRLDDAELEAILAHELCHIRRRDNLLATIHMAVEAIFWFHPLVWWLGARLEEERERACDEEVVRMGGEPQIYAESILKVCEFYLASPVACAAGVTGGELKKRIEGIMTNRFTRNLSFGKRILLAAAAMLAIAAPIVVGLLNPPRGRAQSQAGGAAPVFEVASVKPAGPYVSGPSGGMVGGPGTGDPGRVTFPRASMTYLLAEAYDVAGDQILGPAWLNSPEYRYVIFATMSPNTTTGEFRLMLQNLLAERFHVRVHHETQSRPGYELVIAAGGTKLKEWTPPADTPPFRYGLDATGFPKMPPGGTFFAGLSALTSGGSPVFRVVYRDSMAVFCRALGAMINTSNGTPVNSPQPKVIDRTGLTGTYEIRLEFFDGLRPLSAPAGGETGVPVASDPGEAPSIFTAVEKQLGLKLQKVKDVAVDMLVVDSADKVPTEN